MFSDVMLETKVIIHESLFRRPNGATEVPSKEPHAYSAYPAYPAYLFAADI